jgi:hypothetical protein
MGRQISVRMKARIEGRKREERKHMMKEKELP